MLLASGRNCFTKQDALKALRQSPRGFKEAVARAVKKGRLASPRRGFYLILRPEDRSLGAPDPGRWIEPLMAHLGLDYRISLLRAAAFHGAAHQAAMVFQVITSRQLAPIKIGRQRIEFVYQTPQAFAAANRPAWLERLKTPAGYAKIAGIELTLLDACRYFHRAGGINGAAQIVHDLGTKATGRILAEAAIVYENSAVRRLGYLLEHFGHARQARTLQPFADEAKSFKPLDPSFKPVTAQPRGDRNEGWKLDINVGVEIDE